MSVTIEEFDDDTDFALPSAPAPSSSTAMTGTGGAGMPPGMPQGMEGLQQMMAQMQAGGGGGGGGPGGMPSGMPPGMFGNAGAMLPPEVQLSAEEKQWTTVYPIYFDAKQRFEKGCRRIAYDQSCLWPVSHAIEDACAKLNLMYVHEPRKTHPRDWQNPGRVKVQMRKSDGSPYVHSIKSKKQLLSAIAKIIQDDCGGRPPALDVVAAKKKAALEAVSAAKKAKKTAAATTATGKKAAPAGKSLRLPQNNKNASSKATHKEYAHRSKVRIDPQDRIKSVKRAADREPDLPPYSPSYAAGLLNSDFSSMMGNVGGPLGAMMGQMGLGGGAGDDADEDAEGDANDAKQLEQGKQKKDPLQNLSRRQRKRVIRVGR